MSIIKQLRQEKGWTQPELAKRLNTKASTISILETGKRKVSYDYALRLSEVFEVDKDIFLSDDATDCALKSADGNCISASVIGIVSEHVQYRNDVTYTGEINKITFPEPLIATPSQDGNYYGLIVEDSMIFYQEQAAKHGGKLIVLCIHANQAPRDIRPDDTLIERIENNGFHQYAKVEPAKLTHSGYLVVGYMATV